MSVFRKVLPLLAMMLLSLASFLVPPAASLSISVSGGAPAQGTPLVVAVSTPGPVDNVILFWKGAAWPLRETAPGRYEALIGVDLLASAGSEPLAAESVKEGVRTRVERAMEVADRVFPVQELTLPKGLAEFDAPTLRRIGEEKEALDARLARVTLPPAGGGVPAGKFRLPPRDQRRAAGAAFRRGYPPSRGDPRARDRRRGGRPRL
jgi:hypothetical protein